MKSISKAIDRARDEGKKQELEYLLDLRESFREGDEKIINDFCDSFLKIFPYCVLLAVILTITFLYVCNEEVLQAIYVGVPFVIIVFANRLIGKIRSNKSE